MLLGAESAVGRVPKSPQSADFGARRKADSAAGLLAVPLCPSALLPIRHWSNISAPSPLPPVDSSNLPTRWSRGPESVLYIVIYVYWHRMTPAGDLQRQRSGTQPSRRASSGAWPGGLRGVALSCGARIQARVCAEVAPGPWSRRRSKQWSKAGGAPAQYAPPQRADRAGTRTRRQLMRVSPRRPGRRPGVSQASPRRRPGGGGLWTIRR